jgi:hypothetical protein
MCVVIAFKPGLFCFNDMFTCIVCGLNICADLMNKQNKKKSTRAESGAS